MENLPEYVPLLNPGPTARLYLPFLLFFAPFPCSSLCLSLGFFVRPVSAAQRRWFFDFCVVLMVGLRSSPGRIPDPASHFLSTPTPCALSEVDRTFSVSGEVNDTRYRALPETRCAARHCFHRHSILSPLGYTSCLRTASDVY